MSTLATGVNIPGIDAVVIRDGCTWNGARFQPLSKAQYDQMVGRTGRGEGRDGESYYMEETENNDASFEELAAAATTDLFFHLRGDDAFGCTFLECLHAGGLPPEDPFVAFCHLLVPLPCSVTMNMTHVARYVVGPHRREDLAQREQVLATAGHRSQRARLLYDELMARLPAWSLANDIDLLFLCLQYPDVMHVTKLDLRGPG